MKEVFDLQELRAELDAGDAELLAMFPRRRNWNTDDMVLVHRKPNKLFMLLFHAREELYLERKEDIAIRRKREKATAQWLIGLAAGTCLAFEIFAVLRGSGVMWMWAGMFVVCILPTLMKVPPEVTGKKRCDSQSEKKGKSRWKLS